MNCGIYEISHPATGRSYVGSAVNIKKRWKEHRRTLETGKHHSKFMMRTAAKYGIDSLEFKVLLFCSRDNLLMYEQRAIDVIKPEFNSAPIAGSQLGFRMSDESKAKLSEAAKRTRNFTGHRHSEESKALISASRKGKGGGPRSPERLAKIGAAHKGRPKSAEQKAKISETLSGRSTGRGLLSVEQVLEIRRLWNDGLRKSEIAKALAVKPSWVNTVVDGHGYSWVK